MCVQYLENEMLCPCLIMSVLGITRCSLKKYENIWMFIFISDAPLTLLCLPSPRSSYKTYFQESQKMLGHLPLSSRRGFIQYMVFLYRLPFLYGAIYLFFVAVGFRNPSILRSFNEFKAGKIIQTGFLHKIAEEFLHVATTFEINLLD